LEEELTALSNQYQQVKSEHDTTTQWVGGFFGAVILLASIVALSTGAYFVGILCLLVGVGIIIVSIRITQNSKKNTEFRLDILDKAIKGKQSELEKHRKIISG
jgi:cadmium resistance protein CadD (predicted permease)